jgi:hypothetical protein
MSTMRFGRGGPDPTRPDPSPEAANYYDEYPELKGIGWVLFSAMALGLVGAWAIIEGALAISSSKVYAPNAHYVFSDLRTWGWIVMILGILAVIASFALFAGSELARWFAIAVAGINAFGQLMFADANPWWSVAMFTVDVLIIYGLAVYGGSRLRGR